MKNSISPRAMMTFSVLATGVLASAASADALFQDDFENTLGKWTGKNGGTHHGMLVIDPFDHSNTVLTFNGLNSAGDMFSRAALTLEDDTTYVISFDYLGLATGEARGGDHGGYVGFSEDMPARHAWKWATGTSSGAEDVLIDNNQWNSYEFEFTTADLGLNGTVHLMIEDFSGSAGAAEDVYFDNFVVGPATVPAPSTAALLGLTGLGVARRRRA
ncbi:MAG: PEP-CTERM sorting domain-containing protein [Phycisphaerales bacterium]